MFVAGSGMSHESLSILVRFAPNLLSVLDSSSLASGIAALVRFRQKPSRWLSEPLLNTKKPTKVGFFRGHIHI